MKNLFLLLIILTGSLICFTTILLAQKIPAALGNSSESLAYDPY